MAETDAEVRAILGDDAKLGEVTKAVFDMVDKDNSGQIDYHELKHALTTFAREAGITPPTDDQVSNALTTLDTDGSKTIDLNEFKELVRELLGALLS